MADMRGLDPDTIRTLKRLLQIASGRKNRVERALPSGVRRAMRDRFEGYLYSTSRTPATVAGTFPVWAAQTRDWFTGAIGQGGAQGFAAGFNLTRIQTNMTQAGRLTSDQGFSAGRLGFQVKGKTSAAVAVEEVDHRDQRGILEGTHAAFEYSSGAKRRWLGPLYFWPPGVGAAGSVALDGAAAQVQMSIPTNGAPVAGAMKKLSDRIVLEPQQDFSCSWACPTAIGGAIAATGEQLDVTILLWGKYRQRVRAS